MAMHLGRSSNDTRLQSDNTYLPDQYLIEVVRKSSVLVIVSSGKQQRCQSILQQPRCSLSGHVTFQPASILEEDDRIHPGEEIGIYFIYEFNREHHISDTIWNHIIPPDHSMNNPIQIPASEDETYPNKCPPVTMFFNDSRVDAICIPIPTVMKISLAIRGFPDFD